MPRNFDPVDRALDTLRSDAWTPASTNQELEDKLMQQFNGSNSGFKMKSHPVLMVAAVLLVGGVTFAGVAQLRSWLVEVDINGQKTYVEIGENDSERMTFETEDGGTATVEISQDSADGEDTTTVSVHVANDGNIEEEVAVAKRRIVQDGEPENLGTEVLGDAEPVYAWRTTDADNELYLFESEDGSSMDLYIASTVKGETLVRMVASPPADLFDGVEPRFDVDGSMLTMTLDDGKGREAVLKFMVAASMDEAEALMGNDDISVGTPDGEVRVRVRAPGDN